jgi:hypothetical protein
MVVDDLIRDTGSEQLGRAAVEGFTEHNKVYVEIFGALQDDICDVMLGCRRDLCGGGDSSGGREVIHCLTDHSPIVRRDIVITGDDSESSAPNYLAWNDMDGGDVQKVHRRRSQVGQLPCVLEHCILIGR